MKHVAIYLVIFPLSGAAGDQIARGEWWKLCLTAVAGVAALWTNWQYRELDDRQPKCPPLFPNHE